METQNQTVNIDDAAINLQEIRNTLIASLDSPNDQPKTKDVIRSLHEAQRRERATRERKLLGKYGNQIISHFAEGKEVEPCKISPQIIPIIESDSLEGRLFRAATLLWSVPVSRGYGRRIRYLVIDQQNSKLIFRSEVFDEMMESAEKYGFGSPFCTGEYLRKRQPVFELPEL